MTFSLVGYADGSSVSLKDAGHYSMMRTIKHFASGQLVLVSQSTVSSSINLVKRMSPKSASLSEQTWTLTATSATEFSVTGSISGAQSAATVGVLYAGLIEFIIEPDVSAYTIGDEFVLSNSNGIGAIHQTDYTGAGNGEVTLLTMIAQTAQVWTLTCTVAAANGGTFSVTGSVSGAQADATVGLFYSNGIVAFLINDGVVDFEVGDSFTFEAQTKTLPLADRWTVLYFDDTTDVHELIMYGEGKVGVEGVYVGFRTIQDVGNDYYNLCVSTMQSYNPNNTFDTQSHFNESTMPLWNFDVQYWLRITARQICYVTQLEGYWDIGGGGQFLGYYDPGLYPYPVMVLGSLMGYSTTRYSDTVREFPVARRLTTAGPKILWLDGSYKFPLTWPYDRNTATPGTQWAGTAADVAELSYAGVGDGRMRYYRRILKGAPVEVWTFTAISATEFTVSGAVTGGKPNATVDVAYSDIIEFTIVDGAVPFEIGDQFTLSFSKSFSLQPIVFYDSTTGNIVGELEAIRYVTGSGNAAGNIIDAGGSDHIVCRNIQRTGFNDYCTLELD